MKRLQKNNLKHYLIIFFLSLYALLPSLDKYSRKTDIEAHTKAYSQSQYVMGEASPQKIDDDTLYTYAGFAYWRGEDPTRINFEHPPLGKYIIGLSHKLFDNSLLINVPIFIFILVLLYKLSRRIGISPLLSYLPLVFISTSSLFMDHLGRGLMDLQQLLFTLLFFNIILGDSKYKTVLLGVTIGVIASVKYPFPIIGLFGLITLLDFYKEKRLREGFVALFIGVLTYLLTYLMYFFNSHSIIDFVKFEWYRYKWWTGMRTIPKFLLIKTIFLGTFQSWWDNNIYEVAKNFTRWWAILFSINIISTPIQIKKYPKTLYIIIYSLLLLLLYLFGSAANERYIIQLIPFWAIGFTIALSAVSTKNDSFLSRFIK